MRSLFAALIVGALVALGAAFHPPALHAQTYPTQTPVYIPSVILAPQTLTVIGTSQPFQVNGQGTVMFRIAGTNTGLVSTFQITEARQGTPTWQDVSLEKVGVGIVQSITGNGVYRVNASGAVQGRLNISAISTGTVILSMSGSPGMFYTNQGVTLRRPSYSATVTALAPASAATDLVTLTGSATQVARVTYASCTGISTANAAATITLVKRSAANTGGTSAAMTAVPHDSSAPAATATALSYTANPTVGAVVGTIRSGKISTNTAATSTIPTYDVTWTFGDRPAGEIVLRGIAEVIAINGAGGTFSAGAALNCSMEWME
jgi:hypothetical protein